MLTWLRVYWTADKIMKTVDRINSKLKPISPPNCCSSGTECPLLLLTILSSSQINRDQLPPVRLHLSWKERSENNRNARLWSRCPSCHSTSKCQNIRHQRSAAAWPPHPGLIHHITPFTLISDTSTAFLIQKPANFYYTHY